MLYSKYDAAEFDVLSNFNSKDLLQTLPLSYP